MAEKYGVKPKIFTKEWWPYFWMYYKWHTIAILFVGILAITWIVQCSRNVEPDLGIVCCGSMMFESEKWDNVSNKLAEDINDINGDEEKRIAITSLIMIDDAQYAEQNYAMQIKHTCSFTEEPTYVYIYDKASVDANVSEDTGALFHTTDTWLKTDIGEDRLYGVQDGKSHAVSLADSTILNDAGIDCADLYLLIKYDTDSPYRNEKAFENAVIVANKLIK